MVPVVISCCQKLGVQEQGGHSHRGRQNQAVIIYTENPEVVEIDQKNCQRVIWERGVRNPRRWQKRETAEVKETQMVVRRASSECPKGKRRRESECTDGGSKTRGRKAK